MAINFPPPPLADGEEYTDPNSGTWVYDSGTNSWTLVAGGSTSAFNFRGGHDFRSSTPPAAPIESGDMWIHDAPDGTIDGVYTGISGQIANGQLVLWDGNSYVMVSGTLPGYPDVGDGEGGTLDSRYLRLGAGAGDQNVLGINNRVTYEGFLQSKSLTVTGGNASNTGTGMYTAGGSDNVTFAADGSRVAAFVGYDDDDGNPAQLMSFTTTNTSVRQEGVDLKLYKSATEVAVSDAGNIFFRQKNPVHTQTLAYGLASNDPNGQILTKIFSTRNSVLPSGIANCNYFANMFGEDDAPLGINWNIGTYAVSGLDPISVKIGIGEDNTQNGFDYIKIAGDFPDRDTSDDSYTQPLQNFVSIRGNFNTRLQNRGSGVIINQLYIPDYLDENDNVIPPENLPNPIGNGSGGFEYAEPEIMGIRIARMGHNDDFATNPVTLSSIEGLRVINETSAFYNTNFPYSGDPANPGSTGANRITGVNANLTLSAHPNRLHLNLSAQGTAPNFFKGDTHIGGTATRSTRELWESLLTEEQKEQLAAGTLAIPANVSIPGDGSFVRQWWYDQQSAEDQALIDAGELDYPERYKAENFVDTFALGTDTNIDLLSNGAANFAGNVDAASFSVNGSPLSATVESLQTLVATLQTRIETLEAAAGY